MKGLYYRQSLGGGARRSAPPNAIPIRQQSRGVEDLPTIPSADSTLGNTTVIESGNVLEMKDSTGSGLIEALVECRNAKEYATWVYTFAGACLLYAFWKGDWWIGMTGVLALGFAYWVRIKDIERKGFVLQYDLDDHATEAAAVLVDICEKIGAIAKCWHIDSSQEVLDAKYHAGAASVVQKRETRMKIEDPPFLRTNVPVPSIRMGKETLYFLPDRLLVYAGTNIGAVAYADLHVRVNDKRFIEESRASVPGDAEVVGATWQYVNKKGGPDLRFKNNPELPICLYEEIHLNSASGLREILQLSKRGFGEPFSRALATLQTATTGIKA
jgi:hypothetical protein